MASFLKKAYLRVRSHLWAIDNYWFRLDSTRHAVLRICLRAWNILAGEGACRKSALVSSFAGSLADGPGAGLFFDDGLSPAKVPAGEREHWRKEFPVAKKKVRPPAFLVPNEAFRRRLRDYLLGFTVGGEERMFRLDDLAVLEKKHAIVVQKPDQARSIFTPELRAALFERFGQDAGGLSLPESYLRYFFPSFDAAAFVRGGAGFSLRAGGLFQPGETVAIIDFLYERIRVRNRRNLVSRAIIVLKKAAIAAFIIFHALLLLYDLVIMLYGTSRNEYYFTFQNLGQVIDTCDTPYARRAERIYQRDRQARFEEFSSTIGHPSLGNSYRVAKNAQLAVELNYSVYRSLRVADQNGLTIVAIDRRAMSSLARSEPDRYRALADLMIEKRWWEKILSAMDDVTGDRLDLFDYRKIDGDRLSSDVSRKIMESPAPLAWIDRVNAVSDVVTVVFHKPNTMKWAGIGRIPRIMVKAVVLREDRRFYNDLFPVPHRGNDNLAVMPQITKKIAHLVLEKSGALAVRLGLSRLGRKLQAYDAALSNAFENEDRGGSSVSNQVMEMLYTKYITAGTGGGSFRERQIEQKQHELPASLAVDWFWSENNLLEAYVNEIYGGHLYSDIRGFRSQAEIYFMKNLEDLNLREQAMLVAAIKKPSRIKEYALWLKASELASLIEARGAGSPDVKEWEETNAIYRVDRVNYREILETRIKSRIWLERRMKSVLSLLRSDGDITVEEFRDAWERQKVSFSFAPGILSADNRLVNNIKRELDRELGPERSDSGLVVVTTIDMPAQKFLQQRIDRYSRWIDVDRQFAANQPRRVYLEGGARIIQVQENALSDKPRIVNRIIADVGGPSSEDDEWDWISLANRSLGSSLKPFLDLYYILSGSGLQDMFRNSSITYKTYSVEQQRIFQNYMFKHPKREEDRRNIEKYWSWSPRNFTEYTDEWISVEDALVRSVNGVHVQIQELVTPAVFARLLNEIMDIPGPEGLHPPYRSIILGGSAGDQRYDRYLLAYSLFPNMGILKKHTYIRLMMRPDGAVMKPDFRPLKSALLARFGEQRVRAACLLITLALRETVRRGTMAGMDGIGAGKTGTSNDLRDALATLHFIAGDGAYMAGVRLGDRDNYSIGVAADRIAVPLLRSIVTGSFGETAIMSGDDYDAHLKKLADSNPELARDGNRYCMKGGACRSRRIEVAHAQNEKRDQYLKAADEHYNDREYREAVRFYEGYLRLADEFDSSYPVFDRMVRSLIGAGDLNRAAQIIERFALPGKIGKLARFYGKACDVTLKADTDFYSGDDDYERSKRSKKKKRKKK
ncbi:MAG TPA: transglycosylase domain-containing protein [Spirochaetota bacterium]|nr:penicillin-binding protein [Spirochaetota bacterium]HPG51593.1 transglycosylase domain-containing protein [Spirochaetota bacterium]HPN12095.1 transglycosylase domain-containing protein [Spirochaetota bacterium]